MKFISTRLHGVLDYVLGIVLIGSPFLLGFYNEGWESWIPIGLGALSIMVSLITNYELAAWRKIPMTAHLFIDFLCGAFLAASPWIFEFHETVYAPHLAFGIGEVLVVAFSSRIPFAKTRVVGYPTAPTEVD